VLWTYSPVIKSWDFDFLWNIVLSSFEIKKYCLERYKKRAERLGIRQKANPDDDKTMAG